MNSLKSAIVIAFALYGLSATAVTYNCVVNHTPDPWEDESAVMDEWTITVDLKRQTAELNSFNSIFGENPFAILKLKSKNITDGSPIYLFTGRNTYEPSHRYTFEFGPGRESYLTTQEGRSAPKTVESVTCRRIPDLRK